MKKLTVNRLALSNLKSRKKQYTLMIAGIILAMIFSSGIIFLVSCLSTSLTELTNNGYGVQDIIIGRVYDTENLKGAADKDIIEEYGFADILGYAFTGDKEIKGFSVARYDEKALELSHHSIKEGRFPDKEGEIAIESDALSRLRLKPELGDSLTFTFKVQNDDQYLEEKIEKTYTLVGILNDKRSHIQEYHISDTFDLIPAALVSSEEKIEAGGKERKCAYILFESESRNFNKMWAKYNDLTEYNAEHGFMYDSDCEWIDHESYWSLGGDDIRTKTFFAGVLVAVLTIASCVGIVNSFNTNLQERKKQIGLLRAVGATKRQIISIFGREALIIALISAPISVIISYFITKAIIHFMGDNMVFAPRMWILMVGAVMSISVVMIAALVPLCSASRTSPMQSIRNIDVIRKMKSRKIKSRKEFVVPKLLASRDIAFSKGKTLAVIIMLIISFLLGSLGISFLTFSFDNIEFNNSDYKIYRHFTHEQTEFANNAGAEGYGIPNSSINEILMMPYVESVVCHNKVRATLIPDKEYEILNALNNTTRSYTLEGKNACPELNEDNYKDFIKEQEDNAVMRIVGEDYIAYKNSSLKPVTEAQQKFGIGDNYFNTYIKSTSEDNIRNLEKYVIDGSINIDKLNSGEEIIIYSPEKAALTLMTSNENWDSGFVTLVEFETNTNLNPDGTLKHPQKGTKIIDVFENDVHAGDTMDISMVFDKYFGPEGINFENEIYSPEAKQYRKAVRIGAVVSSDAGVLYSNEESVAFKGEIITTNTGYSTFGAPEIIDSAEINLNCECTDEIDTAMTDTLNSLSSGNNYVIDSNYAYRKNAEKEKNTIIIAFASIIILFFAVCTSLVNNSMTSKIREDKRQIGTLRAVGANASELTKAYIFRLLRIFATGFAGGFASYALAHTGIYLYVRYKGEIGDEGFMKFLLWPAICFCILMFAVCTFNLWRQIRKQMKYSIVDNIREL